MGNMLHVCLYNTDAESSRELEKAIQALNFARLVTEVRTPESLAEVLQETDVNLIFFHLDPDAAPVIDVIEQVSTRFPDVALIAISHTTDPSAILVPMRAGCDQFVCEPIDLTDLASAVSRVASKRLLAQPKSRCVCVTGASGGAGATSIASNLALEIGQLSERDCALIDLDLQFGDVALNFDTEPKYSIFDVASMGADLDRSGLNAAMATLPCRVALLSRPETVEQHDVVTPETIHRVIEMLMGGYEHIIVDVPRHLDPKASAAFAHADMIFIVCQLLVPSIHNTRRYYEALIRMGVPDERLNIIVNRFDTRSGRVNVKDIEETIGKPVLATVPNDYQFVARSIDYGRPIAALDRDNPVRAAIREMAHQVTAGAGSRGKDTKDNGGSRRGLLGRLLSR